MTETAQSHPWLPGFTSIPDESPGIAMANPHPPPMEGSFAFRSLDEVIALAEQLSRICPEPNRAVIGLRELLINAVEHGCLGITYLEKSQLLARDDAQAWEHEVAQRLLLAENRDKTVLVRMEFGEEEIHFQIKDPGPGFDWNPFLQIEAARRLDSHGRGITLAKQISFQRLLFRGSGNEVLAVVRRDRPASHGAPQPLLSASQE